MLATEQLSKRFNSARAAVADLSISVHDGEIVFLLGANGAGKTTTINMLLDFVTPDSGRAFVDGIHVQAQPLPAKRRVAFLPETVALYESLSPTQNLRYFVALYGQSIGSSESAACLSNAGVDDALHRRPVRILSKGTRQKVALAIAAARRCTNLVLDEPTSGLDPLAARTLMERLRGLADDGSAVLLCTHDVFRVEEFADRVLIMSRGRVVAEFADRSTFGEMEAAYVQAIVQAEALA